MGTRALAILGITLCILAGGCQSTPENPGASPSGSAGPRSAGSQAINPSDLDSLLRAYEGSPELRAIFEGLLGGPATASVPEIANLEQTPFLLLEVGSGAQRRVANIRSYGPGSHPDSNYTQDYFWGDEGAGLKYDPAILPQIVYVDPNDANAGSVVAYLRKPDTVVARGFLAIDIFSNQGEYGSQPPPNARFARIEIAITPQVADLLNGTEADYFSAMQTLVGALVRSGALGPITTPTGLPPRS